MANKKKNSSFGATMKRWFARFWKGGANALADEMDEKKANMAVEDIVSPLTGEVLCEAGEVLSPEKALELERACVNEVKLVLDNGFVLKVMGNNTVEPEYVIGMDLKDCGDQQRKRL